MLVSTSTLKTTRLTIDIVSETHPGLTDEIYQMQQIHVRCASDYHLFYRNLLHGDNVHRDRAYHDVLCPPFRAFLFRFSLFCCDDPRENQNRDDRLSYDRLDHFCGICDRSRTVIGEREC